MANTVGYIGIWLSGVALIFAVIALASDNWETLKSGTIETKIGLWKICTKGLGREYCDDFEYDATVTCRKVIFGIACKAMILLAILTTTGATVSALLVMYVMKEQQILFFVAGGLNLASGTSLMIAMAMFVHEIKTDDSDGVSSDLGYGFVLDILAWLAAWAAGGLFIAAKCLAKNKVDS